MSSSTQYPATIGDVADVITDFLYGGGPNTGQAIGSYYNPEARINNCVFVSIAFMFGLTSPQLSELTGVPEPTDKEGGLERMQIKRLLERLHQMGLIWDCAVSKPRQPFRYSSYDGPVSGAMRLPMKAGDEYRETRIHGVHGNPVFFYSKAPEGFRRPDYCLVLYHRPAEPGVRPARHCIVANKDATQFRCYQHVKGKREKNKWTDVGWEVHMGPDWEAIKLTIEFSVKQVNPR